MIATSSQRKATICQILHSLNVGGAEVLACRLARQLQNEYRFVFLCLDDLGTLGQQLREEGFEVSVLGRRAGFDVQCVRQIARLALKHQADLIHAHQYTPFFYSRAPGWFGRRLPVLFTEHGRFHPDLPNRKRMAFNRLFLRPDDRVVAVGEAVRTALVANEGIPTRRIQVIYNGVHLEDFSVNGQDRIAVRRELGIGDNAPVAIQVARLDYLKDHSTALRTAERVRQQLPHFKLLLIGEGPERAKIEKEIEQRQLSGNVVMLGQRSDVRRLLAAADVFLLTSISEGIPVTFVEAMGAKLPVVSTAVGGVPEVVVDAETGLLTPSGDDQRLAEALVLLLQDPVEAERLGRAGHGRALRLFTESSMHAQYAAMYEQMLGVSPTRSLVGVAG